MRPPLLDRVAGAPITWGVCEVGDWGVQLAPDRVLRELAAVGLRATELGPDGYLSADPTGLRELLAGHGLELVAGFVPAVLHDPDRLDQELAGVERQAATLAGAGARVLVLAAAVGSDGYEAGGELGDDDWRRLFAGLARAEGIAEDHGLVAVLHPHYGTVVQRDAHVDRVLDGAEIGICVDVGHLMVGGADPVAVTESALDRIRHVHLKDVDADLAARVRRGEIGYRDAVAAGLYRPLGRGDVDIGKVVRLLEGAGYDGWYVLEQDRVLERVPADGEGPVVDAAASVRFLTELSAA